MTTTKGNYKSCGNESCDCMQGTYPCIYMASGEEPNPGSPCNDEFWDGTDGACPAWWRGYDLGYTSTVNAINQALDSFDKGNYDGYTNFGGEELNKLVERIKKLYTKEG